ncbi:hypothetical protein NE237_018472 [Protea cynaroides]|uniref:Uncharacterized protein n=1 Tax=Protea cynaroides TaxID=273540 RepID=A0A9Q0K9X3_9MAGN|nr:hypothetical protein NE237_018472 [Protea cynaroides]
MNHCKDKLNLNPNLNANTAVYSGGSSSKSRLNFAGSSESSRGGLGHDRGDDFVFNGGIRKRQRSDREDSSSETEPKIIVPPQDGEAKNSNHMEIEPLQQQISSLPFGDQKGISEILYQALLPPTSSQPTNYNADVNVSSSSSSGFWVRRSLYLFFPTFPLQA